MALSREERVRRYAAAIQKDIVSCPNEQVWEGSYVASWIIGSPTDIADLVMSHEVPDKLQDDVIARLYCPGCHNRFESYEEVGIKHDFERLHEETLDLGITRYSEKLFAFQKHLASNPLAGILHPVGKAIIKEIKKAPRVRCTDQEWFRARPTLEHGFGPAPAEFVPEQRYNNSGQSRWYFANKPSAAVCEATHEESAWVQKFDVGHLDTMLDLRSWLPDDERNFDEQGDFHLPHGLLVVALIFQDFLTQSHWPLDGADKRAWKQEYLVPRFVADAAQLAGFKGLLCRSVRYPADNLVVFDTSWSPTPLGPPTQVTLEPHERGIRQRIFINEGQTIVFPMEADTFPPDPSPSS